MLASLFSGVAGLRNHQTRMNVIGNNISNINTIGYKAARSIFQEALIQTLKSAGRPSAVSGGTNPIQLGLGISVASIDNIFTQGGLEITGNITDLAIQGNGFFILSDGNQQFYTRAGAFGFDANSYLVSPSNGLYVQGKMANSNGTIPSTATIGNIKLPFGQQDPPQSTATVQFGNNLDTSVSRSTADITDGTTPTNGITLVTGTARDGAGGEHVVTVVGAQAVQASRAGGVGGLSGTDVLGTDLGVTSTTMTISVDGAAPVEVSGLTLSSTVDDLVTALNAIDGIEAELSAGDVVITRSKAGASYTAVTNTAVAGDIVNVVFGVLAGSTFDVDNGVNHTFTATDAFTHSCGGAVVNSNLGIVVNDTTGLATGISGLGDGGVTVSSGVGGLTAGTCSITTQKTEKAASITVYDSLGGTHTMMMNFIKSHESNKWLWEISMQGGETIIGGSTGYVAFNANGSLLKFEIDGGAEKFSFDPGNGAGIAEITLNVGTAGEFDGLTGFAGTETISALNQNGYGMGILDKIEIDPTGLIIGVFTNGVSRALAQIMLADFNNEGGLLKEGNSLFATTANSGEAIAGVAGETISATISSGALESANVDLAQEFTSMITAQRGFQSNARVITTSDSMLDDLVNLKR